MVAVMHTCIAGGRRMQRRTEALQRLGPPDHNATPTAKGVASWLLASLPARRPPATSRQNSTSTQQTTSRRAAELARALLTTMQRLSRARASPSRIAALSRPTRQWSLDHAQSAASGGTAGDDARPDLARRRAAGS